MTSKKSQPPQESPATHRHLYLGTSGWAYPGWKPAFYPAGLSARRLLPYYSSRLNSVEVNYTFRALPGPATVDEWLAATPSGFRFSFKAPQTISHFKRLLDCESALEDFLAAIKPVRRAGKLGIVLFQLPPNFRADLPRLEAFLSIPILSRPRRLPIAFEFRHDSWFQPPIYKLLKKRNAALCIAESDDLRTPEVHTASRLACFRLRRNGGYTPAELAAFASRFTTLASNREVYVYLKHENEPTGALNASALTLLAADTPLGAA